MHGGKVLIADGAEDFADALAQMLSDVCRTRICRDGNRTLELLQAYRPDLLVLDLMLPGLDGISLLHAAAQAGIRTRVLAVTRFVSPYVLESVDGLGVSYLMLKPCDLKATAARVRDLLQRQEKPVSAGPDPRSVVSSLLIGLNMPTKLRGYSCTREAILCMMQQPGMSITKELYPKVAELCEGSAVQVERAVRGAITAAWNGRDSRIWSRYFPLNSDGSIPRPTNAAFITRLADSLSRRAEEWNAREQYGIEGVADVPEY